MMILPWVKALHIVAIVAWMTGLLYVPRLIVTFVQDTTTAEQKDLLLTQASRLLWFIATPGMALSVFTGVGMLVMNWASYKTMGWMHTKLLFAFILFLFHHVMMKWYRKAQRDPEALLKHSVRFYKIASEIPAVALIVIAIMVAVHPF